MVSRRVDQPYAPWLHSSEPSECAASVGNRRIQNLQTQNPHKTQKPTQNIKQNTKPTQNKNPKQTKHQTHTKHQTQTNPHKTHNAKPTQNTTQNPHTKPKTHTKPTQNCVARKASAISLVITCETLANFLCTPLLPLLEVDTEAPMEMYASSSLISGRQKRNKHG